MGNVSLEVLSRLADASIRVLGLAGVAFVVLAVSRARHAAARHAVWLAVLAAMLMLPLVAPVLPPIAVKIWRPSTTPGVLVRVTQSASAAAASRTPLRPRPSAPALPVWPLALAGVYLAVVVASLARVLWACRTCRGLIRRSDLVCDAETDSLLSEFASAQSMPWPLPQLRCSRDVIVPLTVGFREPVILLPSGWKNWAGWKLRAVLAHELAHIRRGDWLTALCASVNRSFFWIHPLAWWLERHLSALAEQASDDAALACTGDTQRYARTVLDFASNLQGGRRLSYGVAMARTAKVSSRIDRILSIRQPGPAIVNAKTWVAIALCALPLAYSAAALQLAQAPEQPRVRPGLAQVLTEGSKLSASEAQQLEEQLTRDPEDLAARGKLISYYQVHAMDGPLSQQVRWLIQHHPEAEMTIYFSMEHLGKPSDYIQEKSLWLERVAADPSDARILANAARFIGDEDPLAGKDLLERARQADPSNLNCLARLADLMARAIRLSVNGRNALGEAARAELEGSTDASLIGLVGEFLSGGPGPKPSPVQLELVEHLLRRAQTLDPANLEWAAAIERLHAPHAETAAPQGTVRIRVGGEVQQGNLIQKPVPVYPPAAKQAHVQGLVRFSVVIGRDGHISHISVVSGHPLLIPEAQEAVKQWVYRPTLLNGDPVEVTTVIDVLFTLAP